MPIDIGFTNGPVIRMGISKATSTCSDNQIRHFQYLRKFAQLSSLVQGIVKFSAVNVMRANIFVLTIALEAAFRSSFYEGEWFREVQGFTRGLFQAVRL